MALLQPPSLSVMPVESGLGQVCAVHKQATTKSEECPDESAQKRRSARLSQQSTIVEDSIFRTPRLSRASAPEVDLATLAEPATVKTQSEQIESAVPAEIVVPSASTPVQIPRKRHKKSHSEHVGSVPRRRRGSEASTYRRSYIIESAHDLWTSVRGSTILAEGGGKTKEDRNEGHKPHKARRKPADAQQTKIDNTSSQMKDRLKEAVVRSGVCGRFIPRDILHEIVHQQSVEFELTRWQYLPRKYWQAWRRPTAVQIDERQGPDGVPTGKTYRLIFAILLFLHRPSKIWSFIENGVSDTDLPLLKHPQVGKRFELRKQSDLNASLKCFKRWTFDEIGSFEEKQWMFLAPVFSLTPHQLLKPEHVLPFKSWSPIQGGGYGEVCKAEIHSGHHNFEATQDKHCLVAVKKLKRNNREDAAREADILRSLRGDTHQHDHLISLLATYEHNGDFFLIFPLAESDLQRFWRRLTPRYGDPGMGKWLVEQCLGIASALCKIHRYETFPRTSKLWNANHTRKSTKTRQDLASILEDSDKNPQRQLFGRHGDIKPNNILFFENLRSGNGLGTLKITDFGITRFSTEDKSFLQEGEKVSCTHTYQSPECVLAKNISTACDIWALGCLYLEFILWFLRGHGALRDFSRQRGGSYESDAFFERVGQDRYTGAPLAQVKPCVTQLITSLRDDPLCTPSCQSFLHLIGKQMLVPLNINTTPVLQHTVPEDVVITSNANRIGSGTLVQELGTILQDCSDEGPVAVAL